MADRKLNTEGGTVEVTELTTREEFPDLYFLDVMERLEACDFITFTKDLEFIEQYVDALESVVASLQMDLETARQIVAETDAEKKELERRLKKAEAKNLKRKESSQHQDRTL